MSRPLPSADDHRRLDAYLARVRALSPAEWGRLDAIGARLTDNTPWARVRRARLDAHRAWPLEQVLPRSVVVGGATVVRAANDAGRWLGAQPTPDPLAPPRRVVRSPGDRAVAERSEATRAWEAWYERFVAGIAEIRQTVREAPAMVRAPDGGAAAAYVLELGFEALSHGAAAAGIAAAREAAERIYAIVEPVIPRASLDGTQLRLPAATP